MTLVIGVVDIVRAMRPSFRMTWVAEIASVLPGVAQPLAGAASLAVGVLLVMVARGLRRRKARAWRLVVVLLPVSALAEALRWGHPVTAAITMLIFAVLLANRREFYALCDPRTRWRALGVFLAMASADIAVGWAVVNAHLGAMAGAWSPAERFRHVLFGLVGVEGPVRFVTERTSDLISFSLMSLGVITAAVTLCLALRPDRPTAALTREQERAVRSLLARHGARDSLGYFALRRDKSVIFSATGKSVIAYRVVAGVMLASGDPIGDVEAWPGAIKAFMNKAGRHAWVPAVIGCSETGGKVWSRQAAMLALEIGDEAIVETAGFCLHGRDMRNVRQMVHRTERAGYACRVRRAGSMSASEREQIRRAVKSWRGSKRERGFSMALGRLGDPADPDCVVVTAHRAVGQGPVGEWGEIRAVLHFVPWGTRGLSLDLMCRERGVDPGLNELSIVRLLQAAPELGVGSVSLNFATFRSALARGERLGAGPIPRVWRTVLIFISRWFQIESLYRFNAKFLPRWAPRFLIYPATRDLPRIGLAALQAEAFIPAGPFSFRVALRSVRAIVKR